MNWKTLALGSAMAGFAMVGCNTPVATTDGGPGDTNVPAESHTYVIGAIDTEADDADHAFGFNLDDMIDGPTGSCQDQPDSVSPVTGETGVDNQLAGLVGTLGAVVGADGVNGAIAGQISAGKVLLMLEISDINSYTNDTDITVHAVLGQVAPEGPACHAHTDQAGCEGDSANMCAWSAASSGTGGTCSTDAAPTVAAGCPAHADQMACEGDQTNACNWHPSDSSCSGIAAGQTFAMLTDLGEVHGSITAGQFSAVTESLPLSFAAMGQNITLTLHSVHFGGRITATGITGGQFGAQILISELQATVDSLGLGVDVTAFVTPDLMPSPTDPTMCASMSAGMAFAAISATLE
jgi:hypothetical protein